MIINLIGNAIKFTKSGGIITLEIREDSPSTLNISVKDTGSGMAASVIDKISIPY